MHIQEASDSDLEDVLRVEREAFGSDEEAELVRDLLDDPTAAPLLSLIAREDDRAVGHILFTTARLGESKDTPSTQKQGIGGNETVRLPRCVHGSV